MEAEQSPSWSTSDSSSRCTLTGTGMFHLQHGHLIISSTRIFGSSYGLPSSLAFPLRSVLSGGSIGKWKKHHRVSGSITVKTVSLRFLRRFCYSFRNEHLGIWGLDFRDPFLHPLHGPIQKLQFIGGRTPTQLSFPPAILNFQFHDNERVSPLILNDFDTVITQIPSNHCLLHLPSHTYLVSDC